MRHSKSNEARIQQKAADRPVDLLQAVVHGGEGAGGEVLGLEAAHDAAVLARAARVHRAVPAVVLRPEVVADLVRDRVHRLVVVIQVHLRPDM